jgi:DNA polymerase-1
MAERTLLLVDGMALAYRSFYGVKGGLSTSGGKPTNALYGFIRAMQQMLDQWTPTHWQVVFDGGIPELRKRLVPEYKAQRKPMPDELRVQLDPINEYLDAARISRCLLDSQEADDVLATLAVQARSEGAEVLIATSDKDVFQVVDDYISIIPTTREGIRMGPKEIQKKTGVRPDQVVDWLALTGDSADNIDGVPGVGGKTAAKWLSLFGDYEGIQANADRLTPERLRDAFLETRHRVERNREMVRLDIGLPCTLDWMASDIGEHRKADLYSFYAKYEFKSLAKATQQAEFLF